MAGVPTPEVRSGRAMRNFSFLAILATLAMLCATVVGLVPMTAKGVQCPTAAVRTVTVRDCCGRLVVRAPLPGEKAFVQCQCAEKKGAAHDATVPSKVHLYLVASEPLESAEPLALPRTVYAFAAAFASTNLPPPFRPPTA